MKPIPPSNIIGNGSSQTKDTDSSYVGAATQNEEAPPQVPPPPVGIRRTASTTSDWLAGQLYDRETERLALVEAYQRTTTSNDNCCSELVLITGVSGTGKSVLAASLKERVHKDGGFFISGKFDQLQQTAKPNAPFVAAFEQFVMLVQQQQQYDHAENAEKEINNTIQDAVGSETHVLIEAFPSLESILKLQRSSSFSERSEGGSSLEGDDSENVGGVSGQDSVRFLSVFRRFVRAICSPTRPLVLCLDDLQWADDTSLGLVSGLLVTDEPIRGLLVIGTCRGNEVAMEDSLAVTLRHVEEQGTRITEIKVGNLTTDTLAKLMSEALELANAQQAMSLAKSVHDSTEGNAFNSKQLLRSLQENGQLYLDQTTGSWTWNEQDVVVSLQQDFQQDGTVQLLAKKILKLPTDVVEVLKVASCLGSDFTEDILFHTGATSSSQVLLALNTAEEHGLIHYNSDSGVAQFTHDKIQEAAHSLIPEDQRASFQRTLGRNLINQFSEKELKSHMFLVANLMKHGIGEIEHKKEQEELTYFFLKVARTAAKAAAFSSAVEYAEVGIKLLQFDRRHWRDQYALSLDLFSTAAELTYCTGDHKRVDELVDSVNRNAICLDDKLRAVMSQISSFGSRAEPNKGIELGISVIRELGVRIPRRLPNSKLALALAFYRTTRAIGKKTEEDILNLPKLTDRRVFSLIQIIHLIYPLMLLINFELAPLPAFAIVRLSLKFGLCSMSGVGFSVYGTVLARRGQFDDAYRYGQLALRIQEKYPSRQMKARALIGSWAFTQPIREPFRAILPPILMSHRMGLANGDIETAMISACLYTTTKMFLGDPIDDIAKKAREVRSLCLSYGQVRMLHMVRMLLQYCDNIRGRSKDPVLMSGFYMDEEEFIKNSRTEKNRSVLVILFHMKFYLAAYLNEYVYADWLSKHYRKYLRSISVPAFQVFQTWFEGVVAATLARDKGRRDRRRQMKVARDRLKVLQDKACFCPSNVMNKIYLIDAELDFSKGRHLSALSKYQKSIEFAEKEDFFNECGLACEKAALMLQACGKEPEAAVYFGKAHAQYERWGATLKVDQLARLRAGTISKENGKT